MLTFTQQLPGGARASRSRARVIRPALREGEEVQHVVECFAPPMAATTWPLLPLFVAVLLLGLPYGLFVAALVLVFVAVLYRFTTYCFVGFRVDDLALWTAKGSARRLKKVREWEG
jgi:hypothetical protein